MLPLIGTIFGSTFECIIQSWQHFLCKNVKNIKTIKIKVNKKYSFIIKMDSVALWLESEDERLERKILRDGVDFMQLTDAM